MNKYTSLKLSKLLADNGFGTRHSEDWWFKIDKSHYTIMKYWDKEGEKIERLFPAFDILNDLCVKYAKEMFGEDIVYQNMIDFRGEEVFIENFKNDAIMILELLQQNKQDEAEEYIWENCLFNPKNKII